MDLQFKGKYILSGAIHCVTGLHIGGSTEGIEIGGVDNPVLKDPLTEMPYIPGSSLKGKLRHLLEWSLGKFSIKYEEKDGKRKIVAVGPCDCGECVACKVFGVTPQTAKTDEEAMTGPTRLTVRDAFPTEATKQKWQEWLGEGVYTEIKTENAIDRVTSEANPRPMERVPAGSVFAFEMIFDVYRDEDRGLLKSLFTAMRLLENSALGGSGSRGHGQVRFEIHSLEWRPVAYYQSGKEEDKKSVELPAHTAEGIVKGFDEIQWPQ